MPNPLNGSFGFETFVLAKPAYCVQRAQAQSVEGRRRLPNGPPGPLDRRILNDYSFKQGYCPKGKEETAR